MLRLRVTFSRGEQTKYITHLDMMRFWERAFRRARLPVSVSQGFHPHPRFSLASPLPVGVTGAAELMDVYLDAPVTPEEFLARLSSQLVPGIETVYAVPVDAAAPSLQASLQWADYLVVVASERSRSDVECAVHGLLAKEQLFWEHLRDGKRKEYDLRALIRQLSLVSHERDRSTLAMQLQSDTAGSGRPEQVTRALGFDDPPVAVHRVRLGLGPTRVAPDGVPVPQ